MSCIAWGKGHLYTILSMTWAKGWEPKYMFCSTFSPVKALLVSLLYIILTIITRTPPAWHSQSSVILRTLGSPLNESEWRGWWRDRAHKWLKSGRGWLTPVIRTALMRGRRTAWRSRTLTHQKKNRNLNWICFHLTRKAP